MHGHVHTLEPKRQTRMRNLYQLYDLTANTVLGSIIIEKHDGPAVRTFNDVLADRNTMPGQHPQDFILLQIGQQDEDTGDISPLAGGVRTVTTGTAWLELRAEQRDGAPIALPMGAAR